MTTIVSQGGVTGPYPNQGIQQDYAPALQAALDAAQPGDVIALTSMLPIGSPLTLPAGVALTGGIGGKHTPIRPGLQLLPGFAGTGAIVLPSGSSQQKISGLSIDGSLLPAGTTAGIDGLTNAVPYVELQDLLIYGTGISTGIQQQPGSNGWRARGVVVNATNGTGLLIESPDNDYALCQAIGCGTHGWSINSAQNSRLTGCHADFNGDYGFYIQGSWTTGAGAGGLQMANCSTDRNVEYGVLITATGNSPLVFTNLANRRDGSNGAGSAFRISSVTCPVIVDGWQVFPGVNDNGTGTESPATGLDWQGSNTYVAISSALIHAVTTPWPGAQTGLANRNVATRTGSTSAPGAITLITDSA